MCFRLLPQHDHYRKLRVQHLVVLRRRTKEFFKNYKIANFVQIYDPNFFFFSNFYDNFHFYLFNELFIDSHLFKCLLPSIPNLQKVKWSRFRLNNNNKKKNSAHFFILKVNCVIAINTQKKNIIFFFCFIFLLNTWIFKQWYYQK